MKQISFIITLMIFFVYNTFSRNDSLQYLFFDYNISQRQIDEHMISAEYKLFQYHSIIFSVGKVFAHGENDDKYIKLSPNQDTWPFRAYNGMDYKIGYRFNYCPFNPINLFFTSQIVIKNSLDIYIGPQFIYKNLYYQNEHFINDHGDGGGADHFVRSENAQIKGINVVLGFRINAELLYGIIIYCNCYTGLEYRNKHRDYTTYSSYNTLVPSDIEYNPIPLGNYKLNQKYCVPIVGIKLGFGLKKNVRHTTAGIKHSGFRGLRANQLATNFVTVDTDAAPNSAPFHTRGRWR
ncbi:MAG: hypothetical protein JXB49_07495 [Bacteroidales bacterium]|nr:hypothetical protein [Bacteroidales bacterium]